jgi:flagellar hook-basal body complex protein FliE
MVTPINPVSVDALSRLAPSGPAARTSASDDPGTGFGPSITRALDDLAASQHRAADAAKAAATGDLRSVTDYMIAASEAQLATQITTAVRNRAIEAFNDVMRLQV